LFIKTRITSPYREGSVVWLLLVLGVVVVVVREDKHDPHVTKFAARVAIAAKSS
jgi:hypothetical protein